MATFGDFSSLLQLGVGTGIGLSLFRAPVDLRVRAIDRTIEQDLIALSNATSSFSRKKRRDLNDLKVDFIETRDRLDKIMEPFMIAALGGAVLDAIALTDAAFNADMELSVFAAWWIFFISLGGFVIELAVLEIIARVKLAKIQNELRMIRGRNSI